MASVRAWVQERVRVQAPVTTYVERGMGAFVASATVATTSDGSLSWSRRASESVVWRVYVVSGDVRSNTVTIR